MIDPATGLMLGKLAFSAMQYISGARDAKNNQRPKMTMPQSMIDALNILQRRAGETRMPGQDGFEDEVDMDVANNMSKAMAVAGGPSGAQYVTTISGQGLEQKRKIAGQAAAYQDANQARLVAQKNDMAAMENKIFDINQLAPYLETMRAASAKMGAGLTNAFGTLDSMVQHGQSQDYLDTVGFYANGGSRGETMTPAETMGVPAGGLGYGGKMTPLTPTGINPNGGEIIPVRGSDEAGLVPWGSNSNLSHMLEYSKYFFN